MIPLIGVYQFVLMFIGVGFALPRIPPPDPMVIPWPRAVGAPYAAGQA